MSSFTDIKVAPLAPETVRGVLTDLARQLDLRPRLADDPSFMLTVRLALTAASVPTTPDGLSHVEPESSGEGEPSVEEEGPDPEVLLEQLRGATKSQAALSDKVATLQAGKAEAERHITELIKEVEILTRKLGEAKAAEANTQTVVEKRIASIEAERDTAKSEAASAREEAYQSRREMRLVKNDLEKAVQAIDEDEAKRKSAIKKILDEWEWSAGHRTYTMRGSGKAVPSCPVCGNMNPDSVSHLESGHSRRCWFPKFRKQVLRSLG